MDGVVELEVLEDAVASLVALDPARLDDQSVGASILRLLTCRNRIDAALAHLTREFTDRKLSRQDGFDKPTQWLEAFARVSGPEATRLVRAGRVTRDMPALAEAFDDGAVAAEHVDRVGLTAERIGTDLVQQAEHILVPLARAADPETFRFACNYLRDEALRDKTTPPDRQYARRGVTVSRIGDMWHLSGLLDAETGTLLRSVLEAFTPAPIQGDDRSPAQRRHDALADMLNAVSREGKAPSNGGIRPHVGLLMPVRRYANLHDHTPGSPTPRAGGTGDAAPGDGTFFPAPADGDEPAVMVGWGPVPDDLAARLTCDATLQTMLLHPDNGVPLNLGRAYRLTPPPVRRILSARDPRCRWPGCTIPASWCDSHHLREWVKHHGDTDVDNLVNLCRHHHVCVHERGWGLHRDPSNGWITITRPDGRPYELGPSKPHIDGFRTAPEQPPDP